LIGLASIPAAGAPGGHGQAHQLIAAVGQLADGVLVVLE